MDKDTIMVEETKVEVIDDTKKPKFGARIKGFFKKHKTKFIVGGLAVAGVAAGALVKNHRDKVRAAEDAEEAERTALAEEWFDKGLEAGKAALPESIEEPVGTTEEEV